MNKVILLGRLTKDPEMRYTSTNNTAVCTFSLAVNRRFARQGEERQADFISCQAWDKTAEFIGQYFKKGSMIGIVGRLQVRAWDDKEGKKHFVTEVVVEETHFTGEKKAEKYNESGENTNDKCPECGYPMSQCQCDLPF
jgi:single-strand DNA-binding protein